MADTRRKILDACTSGDIPILTTLFEKLQIGPNHPESPYSLDRNIPEEQQLPVIEKMFVTAITSQQPSVISFLSARFPKFSLCGYPMRAAINTGNAEVVAEVCRCDPRSANTDIGDDGCINALGHAASNKNAAQLIKVLLDAGADPNADPPFKMAHSRNVSAAVIGNLPASTFEQFFDAGYRGNDPFAIEYAVSHQRPDILQILVAREKDFPDAQFPPEEKLIEVASEADDLDMIAAIKSAYATRSKQKKSLVASLVTKFRSRS